MKLFVSKIYTVAQYDFRRLDEEKAFNSYEKALEFLNEEFFEDEYDESFLRGYFAEIIEYDIGNDKIIISRTQFNSLGERFIVSNNTDNEKVNPGEINRNFMPHFKDGDIVIIKYVKGTSFSLFNDTIGVVTGIPPGYNDWKKQYNLSDDSWEPVYMVEFVGDTGFLSHCHPFEQEIQFYDKKLPSELIILDKISKHFKKEKLIDEKTLKSLRFGEIYALNLQTINDVNWD